MTKQLGPRINHEWFMCEKCKSPLNGMNASHTTPNESDDPTNPDNNECATVCAYCGAVYRSSVTLGAIKRGESPQWQRWPDHELPDDMRELQLQAARGQVYAPGAVRKRNPS